VTDPSQRLEVQHLTRVFGGRPVVDDLSLTVAAGQVTCLLGPSGCGKSTTLRMIAGVEQPDQGSVQIDGAVVSDQGRFLPPEARSVGLMFQDFALFPHLSVEGNIAFGLRGSRDDKAARVAELLEKVSLPDFANGAVAATLPKLMVTCPPMRSLSDGPPPR
jgi:iron(III) transport system ATP-binding protein